MNIRFRLCLIWMLLLSERPAVGRRAAGAVATLRGRVLDPQARGVVARVRVVQVSTGIKRRPNPMRTAISPSVAFRRVTSKSWCPHRGSLNADFRA